MKRLDPDRFFLSLFAPAVKRDALWALFAFNHEIAKTREVVSETQLGLIRLQWWREEIGKIYEQGVASENEVLQALCDSIQEYDLPQEMFENLIYGREFDLEGVLPSTIEGTLKYIEATNVPLMALVGKVLGVGTFEAVAMNYGIIGLVRAIPFHAMQDRCYLPENRLREEGVNEYALYKGKDVEGIVPIVKELAGSFEDIRPRGRFMKATQIWAEMYLKHLKTHDFDVFRMVNAPPPKFKELRCFIRALL